MRRAPASPPRAGTEKLAIRPGVKLRRDTSPAMSTGAPPDSVERWIEAFRGPLVGLIASWGADWNEAEELAQDAFAEAWIGRARFGGDPTSLEAVGAWLRGIAFRLHAASKRKASRRKADEIESARIAAPTSEEDERRAELRAAFAELAPANQTILRMYYLDATSTREVAALLDIAPKTVEGRLHVARKALRQVLERRARGAQGVPS